MKPFIFLCLLTTLHHTNAQNKDEILIRNLLEQQTNDWNRGDIEAFMKGYWNNDSLMFVGKNGPTYGYQKTLNNYKKNYPDTTTMGKLRFTILEVRKLSDDHYFVLGKWMLLRSVGNLNGHYTLLVKKIKGEWTIIADHSS